MYYGYKTTTMASQKESPRQKMISMMYLVLTALLALNVSDQVLKGFIVVDESIEVSKKIITENNAQIEKAFAEYVKQGNLEAKPYYEKCIEARTKINRLVECIDTMKYNLISRIEKTDRPDTVQIRYMKKLDDFDTPTSLFIGSNETKPKTEIYSAMSLKNSLNLLGKELDDMVAELEKGKKIDGSDGNSLREKIKTIIPVDRNVKEDGIKMNWELDNFYNIPTAAVITMFNKTQNDLKNLESEMFRVLAASSNKYLFKVNKLEAKVISPSPYVLSGEKFTAEIFLSASGTDIDKGRMRVLVGAEYDSTTNKITKTGAALEVENGVGKFNHIGSGQGPQTFAGLVEYKNPRGELEYYPFSYNYMVAAPFYAISADNMNVLYLGVDNPVSVSAAGFAPTDLQVKVNGCGASLKQSSAGKFIITATSTGTCSMIVYAKTTDGLKQQGIPKTFRVKSIPPPVAKINGKPVLTTLELSNNELSAFSSLAAVCLGFDFPVNAVVKQAKILAYDRNGNIVEEVINGPTLSSKAKEIISNTRSGKRIFIEDIKVSINNQIVYAPNVIIKKKS